MEALRPVTGNDGDRLRDLVVVMTQTVPGWLALLVFAATAVAQTGEPVEQVDVLRSGTEGYHTFRIPAVAAMDGTLLAFAEGRRDGRGDSGDIDLVLRRSRDGGRTWGPLRVVWDDDANTCGNPCPVVDAETGTIHLLMTRNDGRDHERQIIDGTSLGTRTVWVTRSDDGGDTWSSPRDITASTKAADWTWYATGPGNGIQLRRGDRPGRLVVPCDHIEAGTKRYFSHVIVSDDHGVTWRLGGSTPTDQVNECAVAERRDGTLVLNMRNYDRSQRRRAVATSDDGGDTWSAVTRHAALPEPICQASLIALEDGGSLVFSNPASETARVGMTVRVSDDGGTTWPRDLGLHDGPSAYSSLVALGDDVVGCLYERGDEHPYERITFARFTLPPPPPLPPAPETYMGRRIATTMHYTGAPWLVRGSRAREEGTALLLERLDVRPGMTVCDMGCGNGYYTIPIARMAGPAGRVYAVDIQPEMLDMLDAAAREAGLTNIERTLGTVVDPGLPAASVDLVLAVDVYHEMSHPVQMLAAIRRALRPEGSLVLVEFRAEDPEIPIKPLHTMTKAQVSKELRANGFVLVADFDGLPMQHMMTFGIDPAFDPDATAPSAEP